LCWLRTQRLILSALVVLPRLVVVSVRAAEAERPVVEEEVRLGAVGDAGALEEQGALAARAPKARQVEPAEQVELESQEEQAAAPLPEIAAEARCPPTTIHTGITLTILTTSRA